MKWFLVATGGVLCLLTVIAMALVPRYTPGGQTELVWTSDPNPEHEHHAALFNKANPDCQVRIDADNANTIKVIVQASAGIGPDLIDNIYGWNFDTYYGAGILKDITEEAAAMGCGLETLPESIRPIVTKREYAPDGTVSRRQYLYPCNVFHQFIFYNKNIFDRHGIAYPSEDLTWDEYIRKAKALTRYDEERRTRIPSQFGAAGASVQTIMYSRGADYVNESGTRCIVNNQNMLDAMLFYHSLFHEHSIEPTQAQKAGVSAQGGAWSGGDYTNWFGKGILAMMWGGRHALIQFRRHISEQRELRAEWIRNNPDADTADAPEVLRMGACLAPRFKDRPRRVFFNARCTGINAATSHPDKAMKFIKFLASGDYSMSIAQGADAKPGNKEFYKLDLFTNEEYPGEEEVHRISLASVKYGYLSNYCPFMTGSALMRAFREVTDIIVSEPELERTQLQKALEKVAHKANVTISQRISRTPAYRKLYERMLKAGAEPVLIPLEEAL